MLKKHEFVGKELLKAINELFANNFSETAIRYWNINGTNFYMKWLNKKEIGVGSGVCEAIIKKDMTEEEKMEKLLYSIRYDSDPLDYNPWRNVTTKIKCKEEFGLPQW